MRAFEVSHIAALVMGLGCGSPGKSTSADVEPCDGDGALSTCLSPTHDADHYIEQSLRYFDSMDTAADMDQGPDYSERIARWEWPPWLKLTAFGRDNILSADTLLRLYPSTIPDRDCRAFDDQPFGRCRVTFYYEDHDGQPCPIYEEFTFNDQGEVTFIEAWSDLPGYRPMDADADPWAEGEDVPRLSTRVAGLGNSDGLIDLDSSAMAEAAEADPDVADFVTRARDWSTWWFAELEAAGDTMWTEGCGWAEPPE